MSLGDTMLRSEHTAALAVTQARYDLRLDAETARARADNKYYLWCGIGVGVIAGASLALLVAVYIAWLR